MPLGGVVCAQKLAHEILGFADGYRVSLTAGQYLLDNLAGDDDSHRLCEQADVLAQRVPFG